MFSAKKVGNDKRKYEAAVDGKAPAPDIEDLHQVILIHIPCKDDIIKACADYGRRDHRYGDGQYKVLLNAEFWGSYISDGMGVILASSNLIKNAVGASGLFLLLASIITPILQLVLFMLALKLVSAIIEPLGSKQIANFVSSLSKNMTLLIATIVGIAFASFITIGLVMCSANIF